MRRGVSVISCRSPNPTAMNMFQGTSMLPTLVEQTAHVPAKFPPGNSSCPEDFEVRKFREISLNEELVGMMVSKTLVQSCLQCLGYAWPTAERRAHKKCDN